MVKLLDITMQKAENKNQQNWWDKLPDSVKKNILKAEKELDEGKRIPHEEVMKKYSKWLLKTKEAKT